MPRNLGDLVSETSDEWIALIDVVAPDRAVELTARELHERVCAFARGLLLRGVTPGERVGFLSSNRWEMLVGYLGTMYMGAVATPINIKLAVDTIHHICADAELVLIFFDKSCESLVPGGCRAIGFDDGGPNGLKAFMDPGPIDAYEPDENHVAEILFTSGSTGPPKGVPLTHKGQLWALQKYIEPREAGEPDAVSLVCAPMYHMNALLGSTIALINSMTIVSLPRFEAESYVAAVAKYKCTYLSGVPSMFAMIAALDPAKRPGNLSCVEVVDIGSAPLPAALLDQVHEIFPAATILNAYGTTEAGPAVFGPHPDGKPIPPISLGHPFADVQWRLVDGPSPNEGSLELQTGAMTKGYLNSPKANSDKFDGKWFKTGDVMRRDKDGFFYFVSRSDDMFVCGGENIYPGEVESILNRHPNIQQSVVVGAPEDIKGMVPVAFVVTIAGSQITEHEIKKFCIDNAPAYAHPRSVQFRKNLPVGGTYKIDRRILEREAAELMIASGRATAC